MNKIIKIVGKEMEYVKYYETLGYTRNQATKIVLLFRELLNKKLLNK